MNKVIGSAAGATPGAIVIEFLWNGYVENPAMEMSVAMAIAFLIGGALAFLFSIKPKPAKPKK